MKTLRQLMVLPVILCGLSTLPSMAQSEREPKKEAEETYVLVVGNPVDEYVKIRAQEYFRSTLRRGPQQVGMPRFMISDKSGKAVFAIGGFVNFRTAYDFNNVVDNMDFITYDIPMVSTPENRQRLLMDVSTSRLYFKTLVNTRSLGTIETYIETDFRGSGNSLRLREAYVSFKGFLFGQTVSTFTDMSACPNTIDFEGPNAYTYGRNMMIQYKHAFDKHWSVGIAAEFPNLSATTGANASIIPQRVPDIPAYVQYSWNNGQSHVRASGILRTLHYYDKVDQQNDVNMGWGAQLSSTIKVCKYVTLYGQALYGAGISPYVQDISGQGLDLLPDPENVGKLKAVPTMAWLVGAQLNLCHGLAWSVGYSQVNLWNKDNYFNGNQYSSAQYVVTNLFYNISRSFQVGVEYLYGTRHDMNGGFGKASRAQAMVQFNF